MKNVTTVIQIQEMVVAQNVKLNLDFIVRKPIPQYAIQHVEITSLLQMKNVMMETPLTVMDAQLNVLSNTAISVTRYPNLQYAQPNVEKGN